VNSLTCNNKAFISKPRIVFDKYAIPITDYEAEKKACYIIYLFLEDVCREYHISNICLLAALRLDAYERGIFELIDWVVENNETGEEYNMGAAPYARFKTWPAYNAGQNTYDHLLSSLLKLGAGPKSKTIYDISF